MHGAAGRRRGAASKSATTVSKSATEGITKPLDPEIAPLVYALHADRHVVTKGSCSGHGKKPASVDIAVDGIEGLRDFVDRLNRVDRKVRRAALLDVGLNWSEEVVTACAFDIFPNWIISRSGSKEPERTASRRPLCWIVRLYSIEAAEHRRRAKTSAVNRARLG